MENEIPEERDVDVTESANGAEWYVVYPNGYTVMHPCEADACEHQRAHRMAFNGLFP